MKLTKMTNNYPKISAEVCGSEAEKGGSNDFRRFSMRKCAEVKPKKAEVRPKKAEVTSYFAEVECGSNPPYPYRLLPHSLSGIVVTGMGLWLAVQNA